MNFENILADVERLVGKELTSINPKTGAIIITNVDHVHGNYSVKPDKGRAIKRSFSELRKVWDHLCLQRAINVEVVLEGAGSSRHHPETILANLPYVDYFKFKNKKHLYLQKEATHELGVINELKGSELRAVKRVLDNQSNFDHHNFSHRFKSALTSLSSAIEEVSVKYPGELQSSDLSQAMDELHRLQGKIEGTIIEPDSFFTDFDISNVDDLMNSPEFTGYDDGDVDEADDYIDLDYAEDGKSRELSPARIRHLGPTFSLVFDRMKYNEIELQPEFQRRDRIWKTQDKSALVESILLGLPIPNLYFAEKPNGDWVVVDGLQRLTTLKDYMEGKFALSNLSILEDLNGLKFDELSRHYQRKYREYTLHSHIISMKDDDDTMVKELFQRINTYGVSLSYQEIRCSLYAGNSVHFIRYIAESDSFKDTTFKKINSKRMKDMEFVLGAVAFILFGYINYNYNRFDTFLGKAMQTLNKFKINIEGEFLTSQNADSDTLIPPVWHDENTSELFIELKQRIESAFFIAEEIFGDDRYKKPESDVISKPLFELVIAVFANLTAEQAEILISKKDVVKKEFFNLLNGDKKPAHEWESESYKNTDRDFMYSVSQSTGKRVTVLYRFKNFQSLIEEILGTPIQSGGLLKKYADWNLEAEKWVIKNKDAS